MSDNPAQTGNTTPSAVGSAPAPASNTPPPATAPEGPATPPAPTPPVPPAPAAPKAPAAGPKVAPTAPKTAPTQLKTPENVLKTAVSGSEVPKTVAIKLLKAHPHVGAFAGDTTRVAPELATRLIADKFAELAIEAPKTELVQPTTEQLVQAKAAYARYGAVTDFKNFQGAPMPEFEKLPEAIQCAWAAVANLDYSHKAE